MNIKNEINDFFDYIIKLNSNLMMADELIQEFENFLNKIR